MRFKLPKHTMRTTLSLDDDVAAKLATASRKSGKSFKETVNDALRRGLLSAQTAHKPKPFVVEPQKMGALKPGLSLDKTSALIDEADGAWLR